MSPYAYLPPHVIEAWPTLSPSARAVCVALASYFSGRRKTGCPGNTKIMARAGITREPTVSAALAELVGNGLLWSRRRYQKSTVYGWTDPPESVDPTQSVQSAETGQNSPENQDPTLFVESTPNASGTYGKCTTKETNSRRPTNKGVSKHDPPPELAGLELYETDAKLIQQWPGLMNAWERAYPGIDIAAEVAKAHAWEMANPKKRKKNRAAFLGRWLANAKRPVDDAPPELSQEYVDQLEARAAEMEGRKA